MNLTYALPLALIAGVLIGYAIRGLIDSKQRRESVKEFVDGFKPSKQDGFLGVDVNG